jgi:heat shock protein HtpX
MDLADAMSRVTALISYLGIVLLAVNLPLIAADGGVVPWFLVLLMIVAPTLMDLLQLALSRAREFDADLDAVRLTGETDGLASALAKLESWQERFWERVLFPGRRVPDPSLLLTRPPTEERIRRLMRLRDEVSSPPLSPPATRVVVPSCGNWMVRFDSALRDTARQIRQAGGLLSSPASEYPRRPCRGNIDNTEELNR